MDNDCVELDALAAEPMFEDEALPSYLQDANLPELPSSNAPVYIDEPAQVIPFYDFYCSFLM